MAMKEVEIAVVVDEPVGEGEGRAELLAGRVRAVFLCFLGGKLRKRVRVARPSPEPRSCKAQFGGSINADEDESGHLSERFDLGRIPDRINRVPPLQSGEQPLRENSESTLFAKKRPYPDEMFALGRESSGGRLLADDVGKGVNGETPGSQVVGNFTLARGIRARDA